ncbi:serine hydrolase [Rhizorhabdus wittichii DC-6]|nr:serine hydrolase [Rhizorhabdus wittichii DC-6]
MVATANDDGESEMSDNVITRRAFGQMAVGAAAMLAGGLALPGKAFGQAPIHPFADKLLFLEGADQVYAFSHLDQLYATRVIPAGGKVREFRTAKPGFDVRFDHLGQSIDTAAFIKASRVAALVILQNGAIVREDYALGHGRAGKWMSFSAGKSILSTMVGAAIRDGHIGSVTDPVAKYVPVLKKTAFDDATIRDLLRMSGGEAWNENYLDRGSDISKHLAIIAARNQPGAILKHMTGLGRAFPTGMYNQYRTGETYLLGEVVAAAVGASLSSYLSERIWKPFGMEADAYWMLTAEGGIEYGGGGTNATTRDYARFGQFMLEGGMAGGRQVLPEGWIAEATIPSAPAQQDGKASGYGYQWWIDTPGTYTAHGVFGQLIHVDPKRNLVIAMNRAWKTPGEESDYALSGAFVQAVSAALS